MAVAGGEHSTDRQPRGAGGTQHLRAAAAAEMSRADGLNDAFSSLAASLSSRFAWSQQQRNHQGCRGPPTLGSLGFAAVDPAAAAASLHRSHSCRPQEVVSGLSEVAGGPVSQAELGRATWTLLHTTAAQFPERPTRKQKADAKQLVHVLSRTYPCAECSKHFREIIRHDPPKTGSGPEFQMWMCRFHNTVNKSINKPTFNCEAIAYRWGKLDCGDGEAQDACAIRGRR